MNETQVQRNMADIFAFEDENLDFQNKLEHVWNSFLELVSLLRNTDYLNFTIIAKVLQELATKYESRPQRPMLKTLSSGKPNLIVVSEKDIHAMCLYIYSESDKVLPRPDEVLICTPDTSLEQLILILLRDELTLHQLPLNSIKIYNTLRPRKLRFCKLRSNFYFIRGFPQSLHIFNLASCVLLVAVTVYFPPKVPQLARFMCTT